MKGTTFSAFISRTLTVISDHLKKENVEINLILPQMQNEILYVSEEDGHLQDATLH